MAAGGDPDDVAAAWGLSRNAMRKRLISAGLSLRAAKAADMQRRLIEAKRLIRSRFLSLDEAAAAVGRGPSGLLRALHADGTTVTDLWMLGARDAWERVAAGEDLADIAAEVGRSRCALSSSIRTAGLHLRDALAQAQATKRRRALERHRIGDALEAIAADEGVEPRTVQGWLIELNPSLRQVDREEWTTPEVRRLRELMTDGQRRTIQECADALGRTYGSVQACMRRSGWTAAGLHSEGARPPELVEAWERIAAGEDPHAVAESTGRSRGALKNQFLRFGLSMREALDQARTARVEAAAVRYEAGEPVADIAADHGVTAHAVHGWIREARPGVDRSVERRALDLDAMRRAYGMRLDGAKVAELAERFGVAPSTMSRSLARYRRQLQAAS